MDELCKILSQPEYGDLRTSPDEVKDALRIFDKLGDGNVAVSGSRPHPPTTRPTRLPPTRSIHPARPPALRSNDKVGDGNVVMTEPHPR